MRHAAAAGPYPGRRRPRNRTVRQDLRRQGAAGGAWPQPDGAGSDSGARPGRGHEWRRHPAGGAGPDAGTRAVREQPDRRSGRPGGTRPHPRCRMPVRRRRRRRRPPDRRADGWLGRIVAGGTLRLHAGEGRPDQHLGRPHGVVGQPHRNRRRAGGRARCPGDGRVSDDAGQRAGAGAECACAQCSGAHLWYRGGPARQPAGEHHRAFANAPAGLDARQPGVGGECDAAGRCAGRQRGRMAAPCRRPGARGDGRGAGRGGSCCR
jgi:hypothetical protein